MNYFEHNDRKGRDARRAVELNRAERAKARDFDGTLFMSRFDAIARRFEACRIFNAGHMTDSARVGFDVYGRRMGWSA